VKNAIGILLWSVGHLINFLTLSAAAVYIFGCIFWLHAPVAAVLQMTAIMALLPLGIAWLCRKAASYVRTMATSAVPPPVRSLTPGRTNKNRWLAAVAGIAVVVTCAATGKNGLRMYECSVGPAPGTPAYMEAHARKEAEMRRNGFERVCEGNLARFDISLKSIASATRDLAFTPVDLTHTPFARLESLGGRAEWIVDVPSRLYRGFRMLDGHILTLSEQDMSADGSSTWRDPKDEPERINGLPARLGVFEDASGKAVSHLSWVEGRRIYELWIDANVAREPLRDQLFALAASLPRSMPACPNEPPPRQTRLGADGRPVEEPMPKVLTEAQFEAMFDKSKRPCK
jgi:hypothetical protein